MSSEALNQYVKQWSAQSAAMLRKRVRSLTNKNKHAYIKALKRKRLAQSIRYKNQYRFGEVERITFPFARHGFFIAVGASRGHKYKENPRKKIDWYNFIFEDRMEELADKVSEHIGDKAMLKASAL